MTRESTATARSSARKLKRFVARRRLSTRLAQSIKIRGTPSFPGHVRHVILVQPYRTSPLSSRWARSLLIGPFGGFVAPSTFFRARMEAIATAPAKPPTRPRQWRRDHPSHFCFITLLGRSHSRRPLHSRNPCHRDLRQCRIGLRYREVFGLRLHRPIGRRVVFRWSDRFPPLVRLTR
jgi:hypothetical protein